MTERKRSDGDPAEKRAEGKASNNSDPDIVDSGDVAIFVEDEKGARFRVTSRTSQIQQLGDLLRGRPKGVDFRTVLASVAATIGTIILTSAIGSGFQYVSWLNSIRLQSASDRTTKAGEVYEKAAMAIGTRYYATFSYLAAVQAAVNTKDNSERIIAKETTDENQKTVAFYYDELKDWNTGYDLLLTAIDYNLDRSIFRSAAISIKNPVSANQTNKVDCTSPLNKEMDDVGMDRRSLKGQFAVIRTCFMRVTTDFDALKAKAISDHAVVIDNTTKEKAEDRLSAINSMSNVFRCYALRRIEYYQGLKELAIISPNTVYQRFVNWRKQLALDQFTSADQQCALN
jgi:hypothetical protein